MKNLSVIVLTKNEENTIEKCLQSVSFCSEIIVIDDHSTDSTLQKAQSYTQKIFPYDVSKDFAQARNFGLKQTSCEWVLFIDADEMVSTDLQNEIQTVLDKQSDVSAYYIPRRDFWWGKELMHGEVKKVRNKGLIRLVKKESGTWTGRVHEEFKTDKHTETLKNFIDHHPHPTVKEFLHDINIYSTQRALELYHQRANVNILSILSYPFFKFILTYFIYLGFFDGPAGFAYAFLMSFHSFLVRVKLYQYRYLS